MKLVTYENNEFPPILFQESPYGSVEFVEPEVIEFEVDTYYDGLVRFRINRSDLDALLAAQDKYNEARSKQ